MTAAERLAILETKVDQITTSIATFGDEMKAANAAVADEMKVASAARKKGYEAQEAQEAQARELIRIDNRLANMETEVKSIRPKTDEYARLRDQVTFAGRLGAALWQIGKHVIAAAVGAAGVYYWLTGRPPP